MNIHIAITHLRSKRLQMHLNSPLNVSLFTFEFCPLPSRTSLVAQMVKCLSAGDPGLIPGSGRSPGEGNGNPLQYSCLENPMDRGA